MYRMVTSFQVSSFHVIVTPINKIAYSFHGKITGFQVNDFRKNKLNQLPHLLLNNVSCRSISRSLYPVPWNGLTCIEVTMEPSPAKTIACKTSKSNTLTSFSESPLHLLTMEDAEMLKKVVLHSVATAFANNVFPVPWESFNAYSITH